MAAKKRKKSTKKATPLFHGPSLLIIVTGVVLGVLVLMLMVNNSVTL